MQKVIVLLFLISTSITSCNQEDNKVLTAFSVYCEMVANDAKPMALHYPMQGSEIDSWWEKLKAEANEQQVLIHREDDFPISMLFPAELTEGKSVVLIYRGNRLQQYLQWKTDLQASDRDDKKTQIALARRFGRLMGYTPQGMNELLSKNSDYRSLTSFKVEKQITHLYYENLAEAVAFYNNTIGFNQVDSGIFQVSTDAFISLHPLNEAHAKDQTKSTAIAFLTDQLVGWYAYAQEQNIPIKYTYKPREGGPHDGFVAIDPGGYLLEFEQFKQHPENELFMASLAQATPIQTSIQDLNFYGSITWTYHNDLLMMQNFYEEVLGYRLVADQGWTKIFQTSSTGFIGLVDERRGMEDYADSKAVELEWKVSGVDAFDMFATAFWSEYRYSDNSFMGPEKYIYHVN